MKQELIKKIKDNYSKKYNLCETSETKDKIEIIIINEIDLKIVIGEKDFEIYYINDFLLEDEEDKIILEENLKNQKEIIEILQLLLEKIRIKPKIETNTENISSIDSICLGYAKINIDNFIIIQKMIESIEFILFSKEQEEKERLLEIGLKNFKKEKEIFESLIKKLNLNEADFNSYIRLKGFSYLKDKSPDYRGKILNDEENKMAISYEEDIRYFEKYLGKIDIKTDDIVIGEDYLIVFYSKGVVVTDIKYFRIFEEAKSILNIKDKNEYFVNNKSSLLLKNGKLQAIIQGIHDIDKAIEKEYRTTKERLMLLEINKK